MLKWKRTSHNLLGGPASGLLQLGLNIESMNYAHQNTVSSDLIKGAEVWQYLNASSQLVALPSGNLDANRCPKSLPAGGTYAVMMLNQPVAVQTYTVTWAGNMTGLSAFQGTISNFNNTTKTATYTPGYAQGTQQNTWLQYSFTDPVNYPTNIQVRVAGDNSVVDSAFFNNTTAITTPSRGPLRVMKMVGVENNSNFTTAFPTPLLTAASRNTLSSGEWMANDGSGNGGLPNDGVPIEFLVAMANACGRDLWDNYHWNTDTTYIDARAAYARDNLHSGLYYYAELSNEVWNFNYKVNTQARAEAQGRLKYADGTVSGTTLINTSTDGANERYIEKTIAVMDRIKAVWDAGTGAKPTLKRVAAFQTTAPFADYLTYLSLYQHIDVLATAPYFGQGTLPSSTTDQVALYNAGFDDIDNIVATTVAAKAAAAARGLGYAIYEAGQSYVIDDATTKAAFQGSSYMYDLYMYYLAKLDAGLGAVPMCNFLNVTEDWSNQSWGIRKYAAQSATQKVNAAVDFLVNKRKLVPLSGSLFASAGAAAGTSIGQFKRRTPGSTVTIATVPANAIGFADPTAATLVAQVASVSAFASAGSVSYVITETDLRDPAATRTTSGTCAVTGGTIWNSADANAAYTITNGGLTLTRTSGSGGALARASTAKSSGYFEVHIDANASFTWIGFDNGTLNLTDYPGDSGTSIGWRSDTGGVDGSGAPPTYATWAAGDTLSLYIKPGTKKLFLAKNGTWQGGADPVAGTGGIDMSSWFTSGYPTLGTFSGSVAVTANFGASAFTYSVPSGGAAWG